MQYIVHIVEKFTKSELAKYDCIYSNNTKTNFIGHSS